MKKTFNHTAFVATILSIIGCLTLVFIFAQQCWRLHWLLGLGVSICELGFVLGTAYACMLSDTMLTDESADDEIKEEKA